MTANFSPAPLYPYNGDDPVYNTGRAAFGVWPNSPHSGRVLFPNVWLPVLPLADKGLARSSYRGLMFCVCSVAFGRPPNPAGTSNPETD